MRLLIVLLLSFLTLSATITPVKIGVLAKRGEAIAHKQWDTTAAYLSERIEGYQFEIVALGFDAMKKSIAEGSIDFVLTNSVYYVELEYRYGISRIATLINRDQGSMELTRFGSVVFTKADNTTIEHLADIKGKHVGAVDPLSFGGWIMARYALFQQGIDEEDLQISFYENHDKVVQAVSDQEVEVGIVRSDTLERLLEEEKITLDAFKIIDQRSFADFPYISSTDLYPEWPFAKLPHTSRDLSNAVLTELLSMPKASRAAKDAQISGWTIPLDYTSVHQVLHALRLPPYDRQTEVTLSAFYNTHKTQLHLLVLLLVAIIVFFLYVLRLNRTISLLNSDLERRVKERTSEVETLLIEEKQDLAMVDAILNAQKNIVVLSDGSTLHKANQALLDISGFDTFEALMEAHRCICDLFLKEEGFIYDFDEKDWLAYILDHPNIEHKVKMIDQRSRQTRILLIRASELATHRHGFFIITLTDISELENAYQLISDIALKDELTGLYNRRKFHEMIDLELNRAHHNQSVFSVIMFDIDDFKLVNDTYGHDIGDHVLKSIGQIVSAHIRHSDTLARWGGEEFVILMPMMELENAYEKAERLRILISLYPFETIGRITCSFGVAEHSEEEGKSTLMKRADDRLYEAKASGKNKVIAHRE